MSVRQSAHEIAVNINKVLSSDLQAFLKCGICCSTLRSPVVPSCNHPFCKQCIDSCFNRKSVIECPICRQKIKKRSCVASESLLSIVNAYLQMARAFKRDVNEATINIPKEVAFLESQAILSTQSDSPMRDFLPQTQFAVPRMAKPRAKRKLNDLLRQSVKLPKLQEEEEEEPFQLDEPLPELGIEQQEPEMMLQFKHEPLIPKEEPHIMPRNQSESDVFEMNDEPPVEVIDDNRLIVKAEEPTPVASITSDPPTATRYETVPVTSETQPVFNVKELVDERRRVDPGLKSDVDALFNLFPGLAGILIQNQNRLCELLNIRQADPYVVSATLPPKSRDRVKRYSQKIIPVDRSTDDDALCTTQPSSMTPNRRLTPTRTELNTASSFAGIDFDTATDDDVVPGTPSSTTPSRELVENKENRIDDSFDANKTLVDVNEVERPTTPISAGNLVICISRIQTPDDEELIHEFRIANPSVKLTYDVTADVTHLIMMNSQNRTCVNRSLKYVFAIAYHCELIEKEWLVQCLKQRKLVNTKMYTLQSSSSGQLASWQKSKNAKSRLFEGKQFLLPPRVSDHHLVPREKLVELIKLCGGHILTKIWELKPNSGYIIFAPNSKETDVARRYEYDTKVPVLNADWVLDSISDYQIIQTFDKYRVHQPTLRLR